MPRPWSEQRKKRLSSMHAAGRRPEEIATALGLRREQVVARLKLIASWERNRATFAKALRKRAQRKASSRRPLWGRGVHSRVLTGWVSTDIDYLPTVAKSGLLAELSCLNPGMRG